MIRTDDLVAIGQTFKPHGVKGEISASLDDTELDPLELRCLILEMDGLPVPFFIEGARRRGEASWLLKFETVDSDAEALRLARHELFALRSDLPDYGADADADGGVYLYDLIGYTVLDAEGQPVGTISDVDDSTANILLIVDRTGGSAEKAMLPFADELVLDLDTDAQSITLQFPPELLNL